MSRSQESTTIGECHLLHIVTVLNTLGSHTDIVLEAEERSERGHIALKRYIVELEIAPAIVHGKSFTVAGDCKTATVGTFKQSLVFKATRIESDVAVIIDKEERRSSLRVGLLADICAHPNTLLHRSKLCIGNHSTRQSDSLARSHAPAGRNHLGIYFAKVIHIDLIFLARIFHQRKHFQRSSLAGKCHTACHTGNLGTAIGDNARSNGSLKELGKRIELGVARRAPQSG